MVGASLRLLFTFTGPLSLLRHRPFSLIRLTHRHCFTFPLSTLSIVPHSNSIFPIKFSQSFHSRATTNALQRNNHAHAENRVVSVSHPWPEWSYLLESLSVAGYFNGNSSIEDEFVANENLSMEFVAAARSCLAFARDRPDILGWLRRQDIEVLINDGSPFLFKSAIETERRMRSFLQAEESQEAGTVDLMKYILSYASHPIIYPERNIKEATESSVRNLLQEMANLSCRGRGSEQYQAVGRDEQMPRNLGPNITMKRGDWICPKCNFMNFARNTKCLECEKPRPQRQLADGEWDCPQCNFFNYRRNVVCLKCEFRRPGSLGQAKTPSNRQPIGSQSHYRNEFSNNLRATNENLETSVNHNLDQFLANDSTVSGRYNDRIDRKEKTTNEEDKPERWFKKVTELHGVTDPTSLENDDFPRIMPVRKGENRLEVVKNKDRPFSSPERRQPIEQASNTTFSPFVPFPPDYFAKKNEASSTRSHENPNTSSIENLGSKSSIGNGDTNDRSNVGQRTPENKDPKGWTGKSLEGSAVTEPDPLDMSEEAKAERWFRRVAQIKDISELSQIPDEDFPSIMPMRKGVNRFVVSKRKTPLERRLTSPQYRKNLRIMSSEPVKKESDDDN